MYEEPYKWVEAVGNRREYLDEQFKQGSPVVALTYDSGILLLTVSKGTPKLYEIYDRLALGGMGHPADLEKLRFTLLEMTHLEGFNRSPSDVTGGRMVKYGLAPVIKQTFEEVFKAPFIVKILLAEVGLKAGKGLFVAINYDGTFDETTDCAVLAATSKVQREMITYLRRQAVGETTLDQAVAVALQAWAVGDRAQRQSEEGEDGAEDKVKKEKPAPSKIGDLAAYLQETVSEKTIECVLLDRNQPGSSKYRALSSDELGRLLPNDLKSVLSR